MKQFLFFLLIISACTKENKDDLYSGFVNPPSEARPFVRWWWNGNRITESEIKRQLDVLHKAGIGGIEINPIEMPPEGDISGTTALQWLSPEWNRIVAFASKEAAAKGMITDMIVGSGWPFGGEFLDASETIQRVIINDIACKRGMIVNETTESLLEKALAVQSRVTEDKDHSAELLFIDLVPANLSDTSEVTDLMHYVNSNRELQYKILADNVRITYGLVQKGHSEVMHGAPGAAGPVMDHYRKEVVLAYLNRLKKISDDTGIPLNRLVRALFCDSIELAGANWSDRMVEEFFKKYGYRLEPYFPFIFYEPYRGYRKESYEDSFNDQIRRVRYDYNKLLVDIFLDSFTSTYKQFCTENGVLCRYQAYGTPFLMGMMQGNMIPDIPESNNWLFSGNNMDSKEWVWNQDHGYMIWNLYASSGGHLTGRSIISCEAMTNTRGVWKASLEDIKRHDDMNFITGMNHSVLHGYNYSPLEAGFPGWVRFGEYFSEQNTWWPYFSKWSEYNARLSYVFQQSKPVKKIAILGPTGDIWSENGLTRVPFHKHPWYCYRLWEPLSQSGSSCDYIDESILIRGSKSGGKLNYGPMSYQAIILCSIKSVEPETAVALRDFAASGGKIILVDGTPSRSLSLANAAANDIKVKAAFDEIRTRYGDLLFEAGPPDTPEKLIEWTAVILKMTGLPHDAEILSPGRNLYQIRKIHGDMDIWFFVNPNTFEKVTTTIRFPVNDKIPWVWNPEDGSRYVFPFGENENEFEISLDPLQSLLLVFEKLNGKQKEKEVIAEVLTEIAGPWKAEFIHANGNRFSRSFETLEQFGTSDDIELTGFAGTVKYLTEFESDGNGTWLKLGNVNKGVTEVLINGRSAGINWYGLPLFKVKDLIGRGRINLEIRYTTLLSNYVMTLKDNPSAARWTTGYEKIPAGLEGKVVILN